MRNRNSNKILSIIWVTLFYAFTRYAFILDKNVSRTLYYALGVLVIFTVLGLITKKNAFDIISMFTIQTILILFIFSEIIISFEIAFSSILIYSTLALLLILEIFNTMYIVENSIALLLTIPIFIISVGAQFLVALIDIIFPPKFQELVPYIEVLKEMFMSMTQIMASTERLETDAMLDNLGNVSGKVEDIAEGYALRKSIGQGIDLGLTFIVFIVGGVLSVMQNDLKIPPEVIAALFASLGLALSTFAGFFGPFYGLAGACKDFTLKNGNYRGATIYKAIEQAFSIPFKAAAAGFLFLDLPPIDGETLEDFKSEMQEQLSEISDNINSLLGTNQAAVPRKTRKMIEKLMEDTEQGLSKLDFRNIRKETNREFALTYYSHEFSWKPWKRKSAVREFAELNNFEEEEGEEIIKLIGFKIAAGQMDEDLVQNVMVSAAMRGVIMMEQKYQELFEDVELGQTCTGLAFGARQFIADHYIVRSSKKRFFDAFKNLLMGIFAVPIVLAISFNNYFNRFFDELAYAIQDIIFEKRGIEIIKFRLNEIQSELIKIPQKMRDKKAAKKQKKKTKEEKQQRNWQIRRKIRTFGSKLWEVIIFPFMLIINIAKWIKNKFTKKEEKNPRELFEEAVTHAALVSMYNELYKKLVLQTNLSY